jgi:excisionase family DNA binding protein
MTRKKTTPKKPTPVPAPAADPAADPAAVQSLAQEGALTVQEAARFLAIKRTSMFGLIRRGEVRSALVSGRRVIPRAELRRYLAQKLAGGGDAATG